MRNVFKIGISHTILIDFRKRLGDAAPPQKK